MATRRPATGATRPASDSTTARHNGTWMTWARARPGARGGISQARRARGPDRVLARVPLPRDGAVDGGRLGRDVVGAPSRHGSEPGTVLGAEGDGVLMARTGHAGVGDSCADRRSLDRVLAGTGRDGRPQADARESKGGKPCRQDRATPIANSAFGRWTLAQSTKVGRILEQRQAPEALMFKRIDHVEIVTDQLDRTVEFYTEVLGFKVRSRDRIDRSPLGVPMALCTWTWAARRSSSFPTRAVR